MTFTAADRPKYEAHRQATLANGSNLVEPIWDRQKGEPLLWYNRFLDYCALGRTRSLEKAYRAHVESTKGRRPKWVAPGWKDFYNCFRWRERALALDNYTAEEKKAQWMERIEETKEKEFTLGANLLDEAEKLLTEIRNSDDFVPGSIDVERFARTGSHLSRLATGMNTDKVEVNRSAEDNVAIAKAIIDDPTAVQFANNLLQQLAGCNTSNVGVEGQRGEVEAIPAPAEPK